MKIYFTMKKLDQMLAVLAKAHEVFPKDVRPLVQCATTFELQKNKKAALEELNQAAIIDPNNAGVFLLRASVQEELGHKKQALADVDRVLELKADLPEALRLRAIVLVDLENFDEALAMLEKLRERNPNDAQTLLQMAAIYGAEKKYDKAVELYSTLLADHPNEAVILRGRADALLNLGNCAAAIADYEKLMQTSPADPGNLNNLAWVLATAPESSIRNGARALVLAKLACELSAYKTDYILSTLAAANAETGNFDEAVKWAKKAAELSDQNLAKATKANRAALKEVAEEYKKELASFQAHKPCAKARLTPRPRSSKTSWPRRRSSPSRKPPKRKRLKRKSSPRSGRKRRSSKRRNSKRIKTRTSPKRRSSKTTRTRKSPTRTRKKRSPTTTTNSRRLAPISFAIVHSVAAGGFSPPAASSFVCHPARAERQCHPHGGAGSCAACLPPPSR